MFKKLKDKIAEEVKSSPQRVQQFAKSVVGNNSNDDNMFSIDEGIYNTLIYISSMKFIIKLI